MIHLKSTLRFFPKGLRQLTLDIAGYLEWSASHLSRLDLLSEKIDWIRLQQRRLQDLEKNRFLNPLFGRLFYYQQKGIAQKDFSRLLDFMEARETKRYFSTFDDLCVFLSLVTKPLAGIYVTHWGLDRGRFLKDAERIALAFYLCWIVVLIRTDAASWGYYLALRDIEQFGSIQRVLKLYEQRVLDDIDDSLALSAHLPAHDAFCLRWTRQMAYRLLHERQRKPEGRPFSPWFYSGLHLTASAFKALR